MTIVHATASTFFGGPERQMLGLAAALADRHRTAFVSFAEGGRCRAFLERAAAAGFSATALRHDTPRLLAAAGELAGLLRRLGADVLCCHGYKADLVGRAAARRAGVPALAVSRGWTGESPRVRLYEALDRLHLRRLDHVVCVSEGQAVRVRRAGVPASRLSVIRNAIRAERFAAEPDPAGRAALRALFPEPVAQVVCAAGRLSPEKGFAVLVAAARRLAPAAPAVGFVVFGAGPLRGELERQIAAAGLTGRFVLAGFRDDLDRLLPGAEVLALPSFTEGLPNVALEAAAAGLPVVATAVGGTPEVVQEGVTGYLVPPGDPEALAARLLETLRCEATRRALGQQGRRRVLADFTFEAQGRAYEELLTRLCSPAGRRGRRSAPLPGACPR